MTLIFLNKKKNKSINIEQRLVQKLLYFNVTKYINELMFLGFEYSFYFPLVLTLESIKGYFFTSPLFRFNELLKLNFFIKEFKVTNKKKKNTNVYTLFLNLMSSFNNVNLFSNSLHIMSNTGARANWSQICQLIGVRGYLTNATGEFFKIPVLSSFHKGLNFFEYFISCYGARKGVLDTALKTADSGYLTRRLVESVQEFVVKEYNCNSNSSFKYITYLNSVGTSIFPLFLILSGKILQKNIIEYKTKKVIEFKYNYISKYLIWKLLINKYKLRFKLNTSSIKLCLAGRTICSTCFGYTNFKTNLIGKNLGITSSQVIGEPGTQLTLRTFHTGGVSFFKKKSKKIVLKDINFRNYFYFFKNFKYKLCFKTCIKVNKYKYNYISSIIYIKQNYFILNSNSLIFILNKYKFNHAIYLHNKFIYSKNKIYLSNLLLLYLSINNIIQRKNPINNNNYYIGEFLFKNILQLIIKNKYRKWIYINLNKAILYQKYYFKHCILTKQKITYIISKNQRFVKLSILNNYNLLYSFININNKKTLLNNISIIHIFFSMNHYLFIEQYILLYMKYFLKNKYEFFKTKINTLNFKKNIIY